MSIPPFLSSTPPPPDKCDERDQDDFDIRYNLSQDSEDDQPNCHLPFDNYQNKNTFIIPNLDVDNILNRINNEYKISQSALDDKRNGVEIIDANNLKSEGDSQVEDLQLNVTKNDHSDESYYETKDELDEVMTTSDVSSCSSSPKKESSDIDEKYKSSKIILDESSDIDTFQISTNINLEEEVLHDLGLTGSLKTENPTNINLEEDVFHDLRLTGSIKADNSTNIDLEEEVLHNLEPTHSLKAENPVIETNSSDFNEDNSNFDEFQLALAVESRSNAEELKMSPDIEKHLSFANAHRFSDDQANSCDVALSDDDDFGDFDAFRSSEVKEQSAIRLPDELKTDVPIESFHAEFASNNDQDDDFDDFEAFKTSDAIKHNIDISEPDIITIGNVEMLWKDIFENYDLETDEKYYGPQLEAQLSTMWSCLRDIDARQPYIVNWNRSYAQQYLLKSLKIKISNTMPKINPNMPRYASNLSTAPLQPMKPQPVTTGITAVEQHVDVLQPKLADGQQTNTVSTPPLSCQQEANPMEMKMAHQAQFNQPPVRQISLPETHIFTPVNSDVPRSQTVTHETVLHNEHQFDDDFQDFQSTANQVKSPIKPKTTPIFACGIDTILEPVKIEPSVPTLNWSQPDKSNSLADFDEFTDFVDVNSKTQRSVEDNSLEVAPKCVDVKSSDDDFDNFQFAPPPSQPVTFQLNGLVNSNKPIASNLVELKPIKVDYASKADKPQQILQPLSLEGYSSINWPCPGLDLQDLSRFNPMNVLPSMSTSSSANSKNSSPQHQSKKQQLDEDWGDFVSITPQATKAPTNDDSDDWSDFVSSVPKPNGISTISFNVASHFPPSQKAAPTNNIADIPNLNFVTPKSNSSTARLQNNLFENL